MLIQMHTAFLLAVLRDQHQYRLQREFEKIRKICNDNLSCLTKK